MVSVAASVALILAGVGIAYWGGHRSRSATTSSPASTASRSPRSACSPPPASSRVGRRLRPDRRQRRRHRRDGRARPVGPRGHRRPRQRSATPPPPSPRASPSVLRPSPRWRCSRASSSPIAQGQPGFGSELVSLDVGQVDVFIGLFIGAGAAVPLRRPHDRRRRPRGAQMIEEVRRQFREIPGLREGKEGVNPDSAKLRRAISTKPRSARDGHPRRTRRRRAARDGFISVGTPSAVCSPVHS